MEANDNHLILEGSSSVPTTEEVLKESEKSRKRIIEIKEENDELHTRVAIDILTTYSGVGRVEGGEQKDSTRA